MHARMNICIHFSTRRFPNCSARCRFCDLHALQEARRRKREYNDAFKKVGHGTEALDIFLFAIYLFGMAICLYELDDFARCHVPEICLLQKKVSDSVCI